MQKVTSSFTELNPFLDSEMTETMTWWNSRADAPLQLPAIIPGQPANYYIYDITEDDPKKFLYLHCSRKIPFWVDCPDKALIGTRLGDDPDQNFIEKVMYPFYTNVKRTTTPVAQAVYLCHAGTRAEYRRLFLPSNIDRMNKQFLGVFVWINYIYTGSLNVNHLSRQENFCLLLLSKGNSTKQIAHRLDLSARTVEHYVDNIKKKLKAKNVTHAVSLYLSNTLITGDFE